jgi:hypothetical protein
MFALQRRPSANTILRKVRGGRDPQSGEFDVDRVDKMCDVGSADALDAFTIVEGCWVMSRGTWRSLVLYLRRCNEELHLYRVKVPEEMEYVFMAPRKITVSSFAVAVVVVVGTFCCCVGGCLGGGSCNCRCGCCCN